MGEALASIEDAVYSCHGFFPNRGTPAIWVLSEPVTLNKIPLPWEHTLITIRNERSKSMARKYKQVHRKEIDFDIKDWEKIERRAEACHTTTSKYLREVILNAKPTFYDTKGVAPLLNGIPWCSS